jgi:hypothetical protein
VTLKRLFRILLPIGVTVFFLMGGVCPESRAASGSCQTRSDGKLDCMEFTGTLPAGLNKAVCTIAGSQNTKWVDGPCPRENVLGFCEVPRKDGISQRVYCYRMTQLPDAQRLEYCRMGCNGTFTVTQAGASAPAGGGPAAGSGDPRKTPGSSTPTAGSQPPRAAGAAGTAGTPRYVMEENTDRFGEDFMDLDLGVPDPALCAEACMKEEKCKAWTYVKPGVQADNARCWLKDNVPPPSPDDNCVSGVKRKGR